MSPCSFGEKTVESRPLTLAQYQRIGNYAARRRPGSPAGRSRLAGVSHPERNAVDSAQHLIFTLHRQFKR